MMMRMMMMIITGIVNEGYSSLIILIRAFTLEIRDPSLNSYLVLLLNSYESWEKSLNIECFLIKK